MTTTMYIVVLIVVGLCFGSFVNAFVWRLHESKDFVKERSECPHCHHVLNTWDLVPILSWVALRGRCRYCHKKIEDSPLVEATLPALFVASYVWWPWSLSGVGIAQFVIWLLILVGLLSLVVYDFRWFILPDKIVWPLCLLAVAEVALQIVSAGNFSALFAAIEGVIIISGLFYLILLISHGTWIGGGDVKLGIVLGLLVGGALQAILLLFVASVSGLLFSLPLLVKSKKHAHTMLPFGPYLILGLIVAMLAGNDIIHWYTGLLQV